MIDAHENEPSVHFSCGNKNIDFKVDNNQPSTSKDTQAALSSAKGKQGPKHIAKKTNLMDDTELYTVDITSADYKSASKQCSATNLMDETTL